MIEFLIFFWCLSLSFVFGMNHYFTEIKQEESPPLYIVVLMYLAVPAFMFCAFGVVLGAKTSELIGKN